MANEKVLELLDMMSNYLFSKEYSTAELAGLCDTCDFLEHFYKDFNLDVYYNRRPEEMEIDFKIKMILNDIPTEFTFTCREFRGRIIMEDLNDLVFEIERRIRASGYFEKELIPLICPQCGGAIKDGCCEYCGTEFKGV